jgi:hypothetical protein
MTPSSKPPTPKTGNVSSQKRKTGSSHTPDDNDNDNSEDTSPSLKTVDILVKDIVGQWKSRDTLVDTDLKKHKVPVEGILTAIDLFLATLREHCTYSLLLKPLVKTKPVSTTNPTQKGLALEAYVEDFKNRMVRKNPGQLFLRDYLDANMTVLTQGDHIPAFAAALQRVQIECPRNKHA